MTPGGSILGLEAATNMSWLHITPKMLFWLSLFTQENIITGWQLTIP